MSLWTDLSLAGRLLRRAPGFAATAIAALALGIAANTLAFTLLNGVFLHDLPYATPGELIAIKSLNTTNGRKGGLSYQDLVDLRSSVPLGLRGVAGVDERAMNLADVTGPAERLTGAYVSADAFALLGISPALGRDFARRDDQPGADPVVLLGHALWQRRYAGDASVIGHVIQIGGVATTVIGVMPDGFGFPQNAELWATLVQLPPALRDRRDLRVLDAFARLAPGSSPGQANTALALAATGLARQHGDTNAGFSLESLPYRAAVVGGRAATVFPTLMGAVAVLLAMACANVANLLLARAGSRTREVSIRLSIGASRGRIVGQLLLESLLLAFVATAIGVAMGAAAVRMFNSAFTALEPPFWLSFPVDARVVGFVALTCVLTTILFGLVPALHTSRVNVADILNDAGLRTAGSRRTTRWSAGLVVVQVALALLLVSSGALLARATLSHIRRDAGITTAGLMTMSVELPAQRYRTADERTAFYRRLDERLAGLPQMQAAIATPAPRLGGPERWVSIERATPTTDGRQRPRATAVAVGERYFDALGIRPRQGVVFGPGDRQRATGAVVVNERFVELFLSSPALGQRIELGPDGPDIGQTGWLTIIGIVPNVRQNDEETAAFDPVVYLPFTADPLPNAMLIARSAAPSMVAAALRDVMREIDPGLPVFAISTLDDALAAEGWPLRIFGTLYVAFAIIALTLAAVGVYAVTAWATSQRTREIGVRIALGARNAHIWWTVSRRLIGPVAAGLTIGLAGAAALSQLLASTLVGVNPRDPWTLASVAALLVGVTVVAGLIPARRAMRLNPTEAIRSEN